MLKEIHEQPDAVAETITDRLPGRPVDLIGARPPAGLPENLRRIVIVACGTSYHAGLVGRYAIEQWARIPVEMDIASEYRYRDPVVGPEDLVIGITQSGETADTLAAMRLARERGAKVMALTNIMGSQATRDADTVLYTRAGLEIGVAATKTFTAQIGGDVSAWLWLAQSRDAWPRDEDRRGDRRAEEHPLEDRAPRSRRSRSACGPSLGPMRTAHFFLYLGRNIGLPVCLEGALKMKEISYIPTDAYAAGEMKHGPIALLDESTPVVCVATDSPILDKVLSNIAEVRARGADVIAIATEGNTEVARGSRPDPLHTGDRLDPAADPRRPAAAAPRLLRGPPQRAERRPAAQPRQDGDGGVIRRAAIVLVACAALLVAGCGGGGGGDDELASLAPASAPVYVESVVRPEGGQSDAIDSLASRIAGIDDPGGAIVQQLDVQFAQSGVDATYET